jgi:aspartate carbamoyltransferase regulatory subunit
MSTKVENQLIVRKIENGTVIDHIPSGQGLLIYKILKVNPKLTKSVILTNVESSKHGRKDLIKIEGKYLTKVQVDIISLIAPTATINYIEDWKVREKYRVKIPDIIEEIVKCSNPSCITNDEKEPVKTKFYVDKSEGKPELRCHYCGRYIEGSITEYIRV